MDSALPPFRGKALDDDGQDALPTAFDDIPDGPLSDIMRSVFFLLKGSRGKRVWRD